MCLCRQTAVHIYNSDQSLLGNVLGWRINNWLRMTFDPPPPGTPRFGFVSCECVNAYLPAALFGGGLFAFFAHLIAVGFLLSIAAGVEVRRLVQIVLAWSFFTLVGIAYNYHQISKYEHLLVDPPAILRFDRALATYLSAVPIQFAFNGLIFLGLPAVVILAAKRVASWKKPATNVRQDE